MCALVRACECEGSAKLGKEGGNTNSLYTSTPVIVELNRFLYDRSIIKDRASILTGTKRKRYDGMKTL